MQRRHLFYLGTIYLPTIFLLIIAELTLAIDTRYFEATIMVSLTSMLVIYTLYQSISDKLPQTAYLKMIDIWLLFCLSMPFLVFMLLVISQNVGRRNEIGKITNRVTDGKPKIQNKDIVNYIGNYKLGILHSTNIKINRMNPPNRNDDSFVAGNILSQRMISVTKILVPFTTIFFILGYVLLANEYC